MRSTVTGWLTRVQPGQAVLAALKSCEPRSVWYLGWYHRAARPRSIGARSSMRASSASLIEPYITRVRHSELQVLIEWTTGLERRNLRLEKRISLALYIYIREAGLLSPG
jgi:hypothetical protein